VIRFTCPQCGKSLKVSEERAGMLVLCRRCGEQCVAPAVAPASAAAEGEEPVERSPGQEPDLRRGLFPGMSRRVRWAVGLVTAVGTLSLLLHIIGVVAEAQVPWALPVAISSLILLLAMLHGHGTACPECGRWWSRKEIEKALVDQEAFDEEGLPVGRSVSRSTYECRGCGHRWSVIDSEENQEPAHGRPQRHRN